RNTIVLATDRRSRVSFGNHLPGVVGQGARLRHQLQRLDHIGIGFRPHLQTFFLSEGIDKDFALEIRAQPIIVFEQLTFGIGNLFFVEELAKLLQDNVVDFEALGHFVAIRIFLGKVKQSIVLQQLFLELVGLVWCQLYIGRNTAAAIHSAAAVGQLDFLVRRILFVLAVVIVIV